MNKTKTNTRITTKQVQKEELYKKLNQNTNRFIPPQKQKQYKNYNKNINKTTKP